MHIILGAGDKTVKIIVWNEWHYVSYQSPWMHEKFLCASNDKRPAGRA